MDSDREPLGESNPIDGLVDRRKQAGRRSARTVLHKDAPGDTVDFPFKGLIMVTHQRYLHCSARLDREELGFLEVRSDPKGT